MKPNSKKRLLLALTTGLALAGASSVGLAQNNIVYDFSSGLEGWSDNAGAGQYTWLPTGGSTGGGCMQMVMDGVNTTQLNPWVTLATPINLAQYVAVSIEMKIDPNSSTDTGGNYGTFQAVFRNSSYSWDSIWYGTVSPPNANNWVTYTFLTQNPYPSYNETYLQFQFGGGGAYSGSVTCYVDNVTISSAANPYVLMPSGALGPTQVGTSWDTTETAPYYNPVTHAGPTTLSPAGSWENVINNPAGYSGWDQEQPTSAVDMTRFVYFGFDVYLDGTTGSTYGGTQVFWFQNNWANPQWFGGLSFTPSMLHKWTHFDFPSASGGITASPAIVFQGTPGSDGGTNGVTTFHVDNLVLWNPAARPTITGQAPGLPGGVKITLDTDGSANLYDQEGITSPSTNNQEMNYFWVNQTPAVYSFTLTNFPSPAAAPGFDAHMYVINEDTLETNGQSVGYNETYSGANWNAGDLISFQVQNGTSGGVVAMFGWKTNLFNGNEPATNVTTIDYPDLASANGTWTLNFPNDTTLNVVGPDNVSHSITLPDFTASGRFTCGTSMIQFGVFKNGNVLNNGQSATFTAVEVTNVAYGDIYEDTFSGPGLTANYNWQIGEYYQDAANRVLWLPDGIGWFVKWNTTASGWSVQQSSDLVNWTPAAGAYNYVDPLTLTNTVSAIPAADLTGPAEFFRLVK